MTGTTEPLLSVEHLVVEFPAGRARWVQAVSDVSFSVMEGETLGLVGESGCGKSTTGMAVAQITRPTSGRVIFDGKELTELAGEKLRHAKKGIQLIFQDPISSLNPRRTVAEIVAEPLEVWKVGDRRSRRNRAHEAMEAVGLDPRISGSGRPHEFSGGQCQRISIARALAADPKLMICDEPVSALDVSVQAQIINLLEDTKRRYGLTLVFITHDLAVVKNVSDKIAVMYLGRLCETAPADELYANPAHPYTKALLASIPSPDPRAATLTARIQGDLPSPLAPPSGCRFRTRCKYAQPRCSEEIPRLSEIGPNHQVACHFPLAAGATMTTTAGKKG